MLTLLEEARDGISCYSDTLLEEEFNPQLSIIETEEAAHGRAEKRTYILLNVLKTFPKWGEWEDLKTLRMVIRNREVNGTETVEVQYYIASIKRNAMTFETGVRGDWGIENACHWSLDITFREDEKRTRSGHGSENEARLRHFALGLLKQRPNHKLTVAMKRRKAGLDENFLAEVVFHIAT